MAKWSSVFHRARFVCAVVHRHVDNEPRYRYYPLYSSLLVSLHLVLNQWPVDYDVLMLTWRENRWVFVLLHTFTVASFALALALGLIGLFRRPVLARVLAVFGAVWSMELMTDGGLSALPARLWTDTMWYVIDLPEKFIVRFAAGNQAFETILWSVYLLLAWLVLRPSLKRCWRGIQWAEQQVLAKWPRSQRVNAPLI